MMNQNVEVFIAKTRDYFQFRIRLPETQRLIKKPVFDYLMREFARSAGLNIPEGTKNALILRKILKAVESEEAMRKAMRTYTLKTKDLDWRSIIPDYDCLSDSGQGVLFGTYIEWQREKRQLDRFFMDYAKFTLDAEDKKFEREFEEKHVNDMIQMCKKQGWDWAEDLEKRDGEKG